MNESAPQPPSGNESIEDLNEWRELKKAAPTQFNQLISDLDAEEEYGEKTLSEKITLLEDKMYALSVDEEGNVLNHNRFLCGVIAEEIALLEENQRHEEALARLKREAV